MMSKNLMLDGLDYLRGEVDRLSEKFPDFIFRLKGAPEPFPVSSVALEFYSEGLKVHGATILSEEMIEDWSLTDKIIEKIEHKLQMEEINYDIRQ